MGVLLLLVVALPALSGLAAVAAGPGRAHLAGRAAVALGGAALAAAVALAAVVAAEGPVSAVLERADGRAIGGLVAARAGAVLLLLVTGVSVVAQAFARRYLHGDARASRFFAGTGLLTAATAATVTAATLLGLAVAWTAAGAALLLLLGTYSQLPAAREGVRRTARAFAVGDGALWLAVGLALATWGNLDLRRLADQAPALAEDGALLAVVTCLVVVAALARSAQLPLQGWLPATLAAPTPVSALLHAGVVNAGGILLVRTSPLFGASAAATHLAFAAGAATAVYGTALMLAKSDVKGALAHSTMGQMGFMVMTCGLGAFGAAVFHLVAHGMYKATLFLGSGAAVHRHVRHAKAPPRPPLGRAAAIGAGAFAALVPAAVLGAVAAVAHPDSGGAGGTELLLGFTWATLAWMSWGWLRRHATAGGVLAATAGVVLAAGGYVALLDAVTAWVAPALDGAGTATVTPWLLLPVAAALAVATLVRLAGPGSRLAGLHRSLYVLALAAGDASASRRPHRRRSRARRPALPGLLVPQPGGSGA